MPRQRKGNPSKEIHNDVNMTCIDWFAPAGTDPKTIPTLIEQAIPGLKLHVPDDQPIVPPYAVNGFINTSTRADGSIYVCVHLFSQNYNDNPNVPIQAAPNVPPGQINQMVNACGGENNNSKRKLKDGTNAANKKDNRDNLVDAGFSDRDSPLQDT